MKRAIIVGSEGQDGRFLFDQLAALGYTLLGVGRGSVRHHDPASGAAPTSFRAPSVDILNHTQVFDLVMGFAPDEIYYLAAYHHSAGDTFPETPDLVERSFAVHVHGLLGFLEAMRYSPRSRLFYAASSHVFGDPPTPVQNEETPLNPICVYGMSKTAAIHLCRFYRRTHGLHVSAGILYNHESQYRRPEFLSQKIVRAAVAIRNGTQRRLSLGDLSATVDWGYAGDFANAMTRIVALDAPDDFIIATGIPHTVGDFAAAAFAALGLDPAQYVTEDRSIPLKRRNVLIGDSTRLRTRTGWQPTLSFEDMVALLVRHAGAADGTP